MTLCSSIVTIEQSNDLTDWVAASEQLLAITYITHAHGDHVAGCAPVLRALRVAEIADSGQTYGEHAYHDCLDTVAQITYRSFNHVPD